MLRCVIATGGAMALALMCAGCVTTESIKFSPQANQQGIMRDGQSALISPAKNSTVTVRQAGRNVQGNGRAVLIVGIQNTARVPLNFRMGEVSVEQVATQAPMKVYTFEELASEEQTRQVVAAVLVGVAAAGNSYGASRHGYWAQRAAARDNAELAGDVASRGAVNMAALEATAIKDHTLMPGEMYGGQLHIAPPASGEKAYVISLIVGPDRHIIQVVHEAH